MYSEDLDLFYKAQEIGLKIKKLPTIITHVGGGSSSKVWNNYEREMKVQKSFRLFFIVNGIKWQYPLVLILSFLRILMIRPEKSIFYLKVWFNLNCSKKN
jgi:GT2 family glycosyltransferase